MTNDSCQRRTVANDSGWQRTVMVGLADDDSRQQMMVDDGGEWLTRSMKEKKIGAK